VQNPSEEVTKTLLENFPGLLSKDKKGNLQVGGGCGYTGSKKNWKERRRSSHPPNPDTDGK
jgi:hypothetical protein